MSLLAGAFDETGDSVSLARGNAGTHFHARIVLRTHPDRRYRRCQIRNEFVVNRLMGVDATRGGAVLPGVV
jgi:hypothetical protein